MKTVKKNCLECYVEFVGHYNRKFCTHDCRDKMFNRTRNDLLKKNIPKSNQVTCQICEKILNGGGIQAHLTTHNLNLSEYKLKFPESRVYGEDYLKKLSTNISGEKNPGFNHGGQFSPFSDKFVKYQHLTDEEKQLRKDEKQNKRVTTTKANNNFSCTKEYYMKDGLSEQEAIKSLSKRQTTFSLEKCILKHGQERGREVWSKRHQKWLNSYKKVNFSQVSQQLFWKISQNLDSISDIFFAELDVNKQKDKTGCNHEYRLLLGNNKTILPDFIDITKKKIIEFDGDYWHGKVGNEKRESIRDEEIITNGFEVLHIKEYDYKENKGEILKQCLNFMKL